MKRHWRRQKSTLHTKTLHAKVADHAYSGTSDSPLETTWDPELLGRVVRAFSHPFNTLEALPGRSRVHIDHYCHAFARAAGCLVLVELPRHERDTVMLSMARAHLPPSERIIRMFANQLPYCQAWAEHAAVRLQTEPHDVDFGALMPPAPPGVFEAQPTVAAWLLVKNAAMQAMRSLRRELRSLSADELASAITFVVAKAAEDHYASVEKREHLLAWSLVLDLQSTAGLEAILRFYREETLLIRETARGSSAPN